MDEFDKCVFCRIINQSKPDCELYDIPILESDNFIVLADRLPVAKYHFIIVSRWHYISIVDVLKAKLMPELKMIIEYMNKRLKENNAGTVLVFEHGKYSLKSTGSGKSIDHFHLHIVADAPGVVSELRRQFTRVKHVNSYGELFNPEVITEDYLLACEVNLKKIWIFFPDKYIPSQYIRRLLYSKMDQALLDQMKMEGDDGFNWKTEKAVVTLEMLREYRKLMEEESTCAPYNIRPV